MSPEIQQEADFFLQSIAAGILLLFTYDILRIFRRMLRHGTIAVGVEDFFYWIAGSICIFHMLFQKNDGIIRGFSMLAMLTGMIFYNMTISKFFVKYVALFLNTIIKWFTAPFRFLLKQVLKVTHLILYRLKNLVFFFVKRLKKKIKAVKLMLIRH